MSDLSDFILGPQVATGDWFDETLLAQCRKYGELFPATPPPPDQMDAYILMNYYDLARSEYVAYKRTQDTIFLTYARKVADSWWRCPYFKSGVERNPDNNTSPKFSGLAGLIRRAIDGRLDMWDAINHWTRYYLDLWCMRRMDGTYTDFHIREGGFALHFAILLAKVLPDSFPLTAGGMATNGAQLRAQYLADAENVTVNYFGKLQYPDGSWRWDDWYSYGPDGSLLKGFMQPFMIGMYIRPLCDLYELTTSPTAKDSIKKQICNACRHLYSDGPFTKGIATHFNVQVGGFHYAYHGGTELNPTLYAKGDFPFDTTVEWHVPSARQLMGTCLGSYAFAYRISGDEFFKTAGEEMYKYAYSGFDGFRAMMDGTPKNFNQHVLGTSCYKGWMTGATIPDPAPIPAPAPTPTPPAPSPSPAPQPSPDGTKSTTIIDSEGATWKIGPQLETLRNGVHASAGFGTEYKYLTKTVYVRGDVQAPDSERNWYKWVNSSWESVGAQEPGTPAPVPTPEPTPTPTPTPTPPPVPPCGILAPVSITVPRNGSASIPVTLTDLVGPTEVQVSGSDGQVTVSPLLWVADPANPSRQFTVRAKNKKQVRVITFSSSCGSKSVRVNMI